MFIFFDSVFLQYSVSIFNVPTLKLGSTNGLRGLVMLESKYVSEMLINNSRMSHSLQFLYNHLFCLILGTDKISLLFLLFVSCIILIQDAIRSSITLRTTFYFLPFHRSLTTPSSYNVKFTPPVTSGVRRF